MHKLYICFFVSMLLFVQGNCRGNALAESHELSLQQELGSDATIFDHIQLPAEQQAESTATPEGDSYRFYTAFFGMLSTLGIIVVVIVAVTWFLKKILMTRQNQMNQSSHIKIIESRAITSKTMLHLVEVSGKRVLIADSHHGIAKIVDLDPELQSEESNQ